MKQNLFGEIVVEASDYAKEIISGFEKKSHIIIKPNLNTKKGFFKEGKETLDTIGYYCFYKYEKPIYIGFSNISIRNRIARFFGASTGSTLNYENHAAGEKYEKLYGQDYENLTIKTFHFEMIDSFTMKNIEHELIYRLKTPLNSEIYKGLWVSNMSIQLT